MAPRPRTAYGYLVIEDRRPARWDIKGDAVIAAVYMQKPDASKFPATARVVPIEVHLPPGFFDPEPIEVTVTAADMGVVEAGVRSDG